jgi:hypothetical protein
MKKKTFFLCLLGAALIGGIIYAADHIDAPAVTGPGNTSLGTDITDVYVFQSPADNSKMVFVMNTQGLLSPAATSAAVFPENTMYQFNIDNTGDNVEDLVIQCMVRNGQLRVYGPVAPAITGTTSMIVPAGPKAETKVTSYGSSTPNTGTSPTGVTVFAGPRDDPFFFDLVRFKDIIGGKETSFRNPGVDAFAGTNVMSIVVEVPKALLGSSQTINVWGKSMVK